jgi:hypothetical protein
MNACDAFLDRLYDEDARRALQSDETPPEDLASHLASCRSCLALWRDSRSDLLVLPGSLGEPPPAPLVVRVTRTMNETLPTAPPPLIDWLPVALWGIVGASLGVCGVLLARPLPSVHWQALVVTAACSISLGIELTRQGLDASRA